MASSTSQYLRRHPPCMCSRYSHAWSWLHSTRRASEMFPSIKQTKQWPYYPRNPNNIVAAVNETSSEVAKSSTKKPRGAHNTQETLNSGHLQLNILHNIQDIHSHVNFVSADRGVPLSEFGIRPVLTCTMHLLAHKHSKISIFLFGFYMKPHLDAFAYASRVELQLQGPNFRTIRN